MERFDFEEECRLIMRSVIEDKFPTIASIETHKRNYIADVHEAFTDFAAIREEAYDEFQCLYSFDTAQENGEKMDEEYFTKMLYNNFTLLYDTVRTLDTHLRTTLTTTSIYPLICVMFKYVCYEKIYDFDIETIFDDVLEEYNKGFKTVHVNIAVSGYRNTYLEVPKDWTKEDILKYVKEDMEHGDESCVVSDDVDCESLTNNYNDIFIEE